MNNLFRTKSLDRILADAEEPEHQMKRALGPIQLIALGIGAIVGAHPPVMKTASAPFAGPPAFVATARK